MLSSILLNEFNNFPWSMSITIAFNERSTLGFTNGSRPPPNMDAAEYKTWLSRDQMVHMNPSCNFFYHD